MKIVQLIVSKRTVQPISLLLLFLAGECAIFTKSRSVLQFIFYSVKLTVCSLRFTEFCTNNLTSQHGAANYTETDATTSEIELAS